MLRFFVIMSQTRGLNYYWKKLCRFPIQTLVTILGIIKTKKNLLWKNIVALWPALASAAIGGVVDAAGQPWLLQREKVVRREPVDGCSRKVAVMLRDLQIRM